MRNRYTTQMSMFASCLLLMCSPTHAEKKAPGTAQIDDGTAAQGAASTSQDDAATEESLHAHQRLKFNAANQKKFYRVFSESNEAVDRKRSGSILAELWRERRLNERIKNRLVDRHYRFELVQLESEHQTPNFSVKCSQTFPFPDVWTHFTPTLYVNGKAAWAPQDAQRSQAMSVSDSTITSLTGGQFKNGDVVQYQITIHHENAEEVVWKRTLWTNKIVLQGLRR